MDYNVELDTFSGPLDLLLFLVKRNEVDIRDIPVARIAGQFQEYLGLIQLIDLEWAGDFLVLAATLLEIKAKLVLPRGEAETAEADDPRRELVQQLLEYKKYRDAASVLEAHAERQMERLPRLPPEPAADPAGGPPPLRRVELWDLVSAFGRLLRETTALQPRNIVVDETPLPQVMDFILASLRQREPLGLAELFTPPFTRGRLVGLFLALLELIKGRQILAEQPAPFSDVRLRLAPPEDSAREGVAPTA
jgi:segregation and condensation protein A